jgi:hypothetical protein
MSLGNAHKSSSAGGLSVDKFSRFENWLGENGARFDQVRNRSKKMFIPASLTQSTWTAT